jgi:HIRAN domain
MAYYIPGLIFAVFVLYRILGGVDARSARRTRVGRERPDLSFLGRFDVEEAVGIATFECRVVGSSHYQDHLSRLAGGKKREAADLAVMAVVVPEDDNPYDKKAVRVDVGGSTVGYLDRANAIAYRKHLAGNGHDGSSLECTARIVGGWFRSHEDEGHFGVRLDLPAA